MHVPPPGLLMPDDFKAYAKIKIDYHAFNKDNMPSHFKIKDYCPNVFRNIREQFGVDQSEYLVHLNNNSYMKNDFADVAYFLRTRSRSPRK